MAGLNEIAELQQTKHLERSLDDLRAGIKSSFDAIRTLCENGEKVLIRGFGTFQLKSRKARTGRNPQTGKELQIAAKKVLTFKAAK